MPSKSPSQRRFFAKAASDPAFARERGLSPVQAKEWANSDKRKQTVRKGGRGR